MTNSYASAESNGKCWLVPARNKTSKLAICTTGVKYNKTVCKAKHGRFHAVLFAKHITYQLSAFTSNCEHVFFAELHSDDTNF